VEYVIIVRSTGLVVARTAYLIDANGHYDARDKALDRCSVLALKEGVEVDVMEVGSCLGSWKAKYDKEPLTESHGGTDAVLAVERLTR
jgi:hypothetical protein